MLANSNGAQSMKTLYTSRIQKLEIYAHGYIVITDTNYDEIFQQIENNKNLPVTCIIKDNFGNIYKITGRKIIECNHQEGKVNIDVYIFTTQCLYNIVLL